MAEIAAHWIEEGTADRLLQERRAEASARQGLAREKLAGFEFRAHAFGYHVWLALPEPWRSEAFVARARSRGVAVTPSEAFVVGRAAAPHAVRLGLGAVASRQALARGLERLAGVLREPADPGFAVV
jgi:DNA-binding transcriptional MocR family regulator